MVKAIVLTCMDYRFVGSIAESLNELGYKKNYDLFVAAGASLMYNHEDNCCLKKCFESWKTSFEQHINLAIGVHNIEEIIAIDHEDCGAYALHYEDEGHDLEALHSQNMSLLVSYLKKKYPELKVTGFMAGLDGSLSHLVSA